MTFLEFAEGLRALVLCQRFRLAEGEYGFRHHEAWMDNALLSEFWRQADTVDAANVSRLRTLCRVHHVPLRGDS